jgi:hypothetical protein
MKTKFALAGQILVALVMLMSTSDAQVGQNKVKFDADPAQRLDVRFRLFKTDNIWTHLLLDTRTGRVFQMNHSIDEGSVRGSLPISNKSLVEDEKGAKDGRFTLYPTSNIWNWILVDQEDGRCWQCQFATKAANRVLIPIKQIPDE